VPSASALAPPKLRVSDAELVRAAQSGEVEQLGRLLSRHQASMRAVALAILGHGPAAEDAVQDACLIALRRIGQVRDPAAGGAWLRMLVRNACRRQLRGKSAIPVSDPAVLVRPATDLDPAEILDRQANRDWIWTAIGRLSPTLQLPVLLRYFTDFTTYDEIAALCGVPVGTIRSRLSQARSKLATALLSTASRPYDDINGRADQRRLEAEATLRAAYAHDLAGALAESWLPDVEMIWPTGRRTIGYQALVGGLDRDLTAGVQHHLRAVVAGPNHIVWDDQLQNPADDPDHCPPSVAWVLHLEAGRVRHVRFHHQPRETAAA
jgi:RNA polymerase sigma factor (sigma-70 family)